MQLHAGYSQAPKGILLLAGATEAARGAADIVLTEPGLSTIVTAIIGARKIFQRMNTYAKYTVAMTFRICLTFGILTVVYDWSALVQGYPSQEEIMHCLMLLICCDKPH